MNGGFCLLRKRRSEVAGFDLYCRVIDKRAETTWVGCVKPANEGLDALTVIDIQLSELQGVRGYPIRQELRNGCLALGRVACARDDPPA